MSRLPVSIVGAGISGLVLGRCLLARGIPAVIIEKGRFSMHKNNHGITLYSHAYRPLLNILKLDEPEFKRKVAVDGAVGGEGQLELKGNGQVDADWNLCFRANRGRFERLLAQGLHIEWEREVNTVTTASSPGAAPSLGLKNGDEVPSSVVVGADGPHSIIRRAIFNTEEAADDAAARALEVLPFATYNGRRVLTPQQFNDSFAGAMQHSTVLAQRVVDVFLQLSISERTQEAVVISYTYSRPAKKGQDRLYRPERTKGEAQEIPEELFAEVDAIRARLGPELLRGPWGVIFDSEAMRNDRVLNWLMRSMSQWALEPEQLYKKAALGGIVVLGDAAHAEPILYGEGANMAIEDGMQLAGVLAEAQSGEGDLGSLYLRRRDAWVESVRESERRLAGLHAGS